MTGRYAEAASTFQKAMDMDPNYALVHSNLGSLYIDQGRIQDAVREYERSVSLNPSTSAIAQKGCILAKSGRKDEAIKILAELRERSSKQYVSPADIASIYSSLGQSDEAFRWLEQALQQHDTYLGDMLNVGWFKNLHSDPRFNDLLKRVGLPTL